MRYMTKYCFTPANAWRSVAWVLLSSTLIAAPVSSQARDTTPVRDTPQVRDTTQVRNTPQAGSASHAANATQAGTINQTANAAQAREILGAGDSIRITVFQNPDLTTDTRISQSGSIVFPLIGEVGLAGSTAAEAGTRIADQLRRGSFIVNPQVLVAIVQVRSRQVHVLGPTISVGIFPSISLHDERA